MYNFNNVVTVEYCCTFRLQPDDSYCGVAGACGCSLHLLHYSCAVANCILLLCNSLTIILLFHTEPGMP